MMMLSFSQPQTEFKVCCGKLRCPKKNGREAKKQKVTQVWCVCVCVRARACVKGGVIYNLCMYIVLFVLFVF